MFRIRGSVPASNYILLPKTSSQSLGLTGRFLYLLFRPSPNKHFVVHLDITAEVKSVYGLMIQTFICISTFSVLVVIIDNVTVLLSLLVHHSGGSGDPRVVLEHVQRVQVDGDMAAVSFPVRSRSRFSV